MSPVDLLRTIARGIANIFGSGRGPVNGTHAHSAFEAQVKALGNASFRTEVSYLNGQVVPRGTNGSIRVDVLEGSPTAPRAIYDLKTGNASLSQSRIQQIQSHVPGGANVSVIEIK